MWKVLVVKHQNLLGMQRAQGEGDIRKGVAGGRLPILGIHTRIHGWEINEREWSPAFSHKTMALCSNPGSIGKRWRAQGCLFTMSLQNRVILICLLAAKKCREVSLSLCIAEKVFKESEMPNWKPGLRSEILLPSLRITDLYYGPRCVQFHTQRLSTDCPKHKITCRKPTHTSIYETTSQWCHQKCWLCFSTGKKN